MQGKYSGKYESFHMESVDYIIWLTILSTWKTWQNTEAMVLDISQIHGCQFFEWFLSYIIPHQYNMSFIVFECNQCLILWGHFQPKKQIDANWSGQIIVTLYPPRWGVVVRESPPHAQTIQV